MMAQTRSEADPDQKLGVIETDPQLAAAVAAVDAAIAKTDRMLAGEPSGQTRRPAERDPLLLTPTPTGTRTPVSADWRAVVEQTRGVPPTLAAAITADAWDRIEPLQHVPWLGRPLCRLRCSEGRGKTRWHLPCLHAGLKAIPRERRRAPPRDAAAQLVVELEAITAAAEAGLKDHDRWLNQRTLLARKLAGRRATSKPPGAARLRADPPDRLGRHDRRRASGSRPARPKTWSPSWDLRERRPGEGGIAPGGFFEELLPS